MAYTVSFISIPLYSPICTRPVKGTDASRYRAILDAADHIEANPLLYDYQTTAMDERTACILGWIGKCHGGAFVNADAVAPDLLGFTPTSFFLEMGRLMLGREPNFHKKADFYCLHDALLVVQGLRRLADRFRPKHIGLPACVTEIFNEENADAVV